MCHRALREPNTTLSPGKRSPAAPGPLGAELTLKRAPDSPSLIGAELSLGTKRQLSSSLQEGAHRTQSRKHLSELPLEASLLPQELTVQSPRHSCTSTFRLSPLLLVMDSSLIQVPQALSLIHSTRPEGPEKSPDSYRSSKVFSSYLTRKTSGQNSQDDTANPTDTPTSSQAPVSSTHFLPYIAASPSFDFHHLREHGRHDSPHTGSRRHMPRCYGGTRVRGPSR